MTRIKKEKVIRYKRYEPRYDFMKNWMVVKKWAMKNYDISQLNLEIVLSLYSHGLFTIGQFNYMTMTNSWDKTKLQKLVDGGHVQIFRKRQKNEMAKYEVSQSARRMCASIYRKLNGEERISECPQNNIIFKPGLDCYSHKVLRRAIKRINKEMNL